MNQNSEIDLDETENLEGLKRKGEKLQHGNKN